MFAAISSSSLRRAGGAVLVAARRGPSWRSPKLAIGLAIVLGMMATGMLADFIMPYDPLKISVDRIEPPSPEHPFGTDQLGRDVFSRVIKGSQIALIVAGISIGCALLIGVGIGLVAGYAPRAIDNALLLAIDAIYSFPTIMLGLAVITLLGPSFAVVVLVIIVTQAPSYARVTRTSVKAIRESDFLLAERSLGAGPVRILLGHVLPNIVGPLFILASMDIPVVITLEAGLSFLGLGVRPPTPSWGRLLNEGYVLIQQAPWIVVAGGLPLILVTIGFTFLGETLRDRLDPRLRREV